MTYTLKPYPTYKPSGVEWLGDIPSHWETQKLKFCSEMNGQTLPENTDPNLTISYVDIGSVSQGKIEQTEKLSFKNAPSRARRAARKGDTIISTVRTYLKAIAYVGENDAKNIFSTGFCVLSPNKKFHKGYFSYFSQSAPFVNEIVSYSKGVSFPAVTPVELGDLFIGVPPLPEQHRIATFLDQKTAEIDEAISKKQRLIELLKEQKAILINQAVTKGLNPNVPMRDSGVAWIGEVPAHWDILAIKRITSVPITDGPHETPEFLDEGVPFISAEAIKNDRIDFTKRRGFISPEEHARFSKKYKPKRGDIYLIKSGATTGNVAFVDTDDEFNIWSPLAVIRPHRKMATTLFVFYFMKSRSFFQSIELGWSYGTQQNIGMNVIENLPIVRPPIDEQHRITAFLDQKADVINEAITKKERQIDLLQEYRTILIANVVTGKIDVREDAHCES